MLLIRDPQNGVLWSFHPWTSAAAFFAPPSSRSWKAPLFLCRYGVGTPVIRIYGSKVFVTAHSWSRYAKITFCLKKRSGEISFSAFLRNISSSIFISLIKTGFCNSYAIKTEFYQVSGDDPNHSSEIWATYSCLWRELQPLAGFIWGALLKVIGQDNLIRTYFHPI